jgi:4'-phosphopantetheinyl transferase
VRPLLPVEEVYVFAFALDPPVPRLGDFEELLSRDEAERADRFRQEHDRRRYVVGRAQLRTILACYLNREASELQFVYGSQGKPVLRDVGGHERVRFNLSRSNDLGVLAMQVDDDVGIDLECVRPFPDALDIAKRLFATEEYETLCALPPAERDAAFFSYWTRKEAVVKSIGLGLSHPVNTFVVRPLPGAAVERLVIGGPDGNAVRWLLTVPPPSEGYVAALATSGVPRPLRCWAWRGGPARHR